MKRSIGSVDLHTYLPGMVVNEHSGSDKKLTLWNVLPRQHAKEAKLAVHTETIQPSHCLTVTCWWNTYSSSFLSTTSLGTSLRQREKMSNKGHSGCAVEWSQPNMSTNTTTGTGVFREDAQVHRQYKGNKHTGTTHALLN